MTPNMKLFIVEIENDQNYLHLAFHRKTAYNVKFNMFRLVFKFPIYRSKCYKFLSILSLVYQLYYRS